MDGSGAAEAESPSLDLSQAKHKVAFARRLAPYPPTWDAPRSLGLTGWNPSFEGDPWLKRFIFFETNGIFSAKKLALKKHH